MRRLLALTPLLIAAADPPTIPAPVQAMLDAAIAGGNEAEVATIVKFARAADPASGDAVAASPTRWRADRAAARQEKVAQPARSNCGAAGPSSAAISPPGTPTQSA